MRVLIIDDHDLLRDVLVAYLKTERDIETVTAATFEDGVKKVRTGAAFDLILLDYKLPGGQGMKNLETLLKTGNGQRVALISGEATRDTAEEALAMGAAGFLPKTLSAQTFVSAIRFMAMGEQYAPVAFMTAPTEVNASPLLRKLTRRELQVLEGLTAGKANKEIARDLDLTEPTIKLHVKTLYRKLGVNNRTQAALIGREEGLRG